MYLPKLECLNIINVKYVLKFRNPNVWYAKKNLRIFDLYNKDFQISKCMGGGTLISMLSPRRR